MEFFIRKDSTDPILKMQLVLDGRNDFNNFHDKLSNSTIYFSTTPNAPTEYYIYYKWTKNNVNKVGRYEGQFIIYFHSDNTELIVPIREDLYITISDAFVKSPC